MRKSNVALLSVVVIVAVMASVGCVSNKKYKTDVEQTDARMAALEDGVEANEKRVADLKSATDSKLSAVEGQADKALKVGQQAQTTANGAEQAAREAKEGKLLYSVVLEDGSVKFALGKAELTAEGKAALDGLVSKVKKSDKGVYFEIEGHTDSTGGEDFNMKLGWKRANAAWTYLAETGGIPLHAMNVISYGESRPVADNSTREGRAQNRRVVVKVLK